MIRSLLWILALGTEMLTGCAYNGAVYSEYTHYGLGIRTSVESAAPVDVELGYGRGVFSLVPKRNGQSAPGEAVSVLGVNHVHTIATPRSLLTESLLKVDAGFISGSAALAAVTPADKTLEIVVPKAESLQVTVKGSPQDRLKVAFQPTARFLFPEQQSLDRLIAQASARKDAQVVYGRAGRAVSEEFTQFFEQGLNRGLSNKNAFNDAQSLYLWSQPVGSPRWRQVISALEAALNEGGG